MNILRHIVHGQSICYFFNKFRALSEAYVRSGSVQPFCRDTISTRTLERPSEITAIPRGYNTARGQQPPYRKQENETEGEVV